MRPTGATGPTSAAERPTGDQRRADERLRAARPGEPPLLRARRDAARVAELLGVTRPQVSRLLKRARAEGIVEIRIVDWTARREPRRRGAAPAISGSTPSICRRRIAGPEDVTPADGRAARGGGPPGARSATGSIVGVGDGASVSATADALDALDEPTPRDAVATVVPLCGGYWSPARNASRTGGSPRRSAPAARPAWRRASSTTPRPKRSLVAHAGVRPDRSSSGIAWRSRSSASAGPTGAGGRRPGHRRASSTRPAPSARCWSRRSTSTGGSSARRLRDRMIAFEAARARRRPGARSASRAGERRSAPILGALRAGVVGTLVTDVATAEAVVALDDATRAATASGRPMSARERARSSASTSGRPRSRPVSSTLDGRLLGARAGGLSRLTVDPRARLGGAGSRAPGGARSCVPSASSATSRRAEVVAIGVDGHGPTLVAGRRPRRRDAAGDHLAGHPLDRGGRGAGRRRPA